MVKKIKSQNAITHILEFGPGPLSVGYGNTESIVVSTPASEVYSVAVGASQLLVRLRNGTGNRQMSSSKVNFTDIFSQLYMLLPYMSQNLGTQGGRGLQFGMQGPLQDGSNNEDL